MGRWIIMMKAYMLIDEILAFPLQRYEELLLQYL
jgi:hypothetical protein